MKRFFIVLLALLPMCMVAQNTKKVAVMETKKISDEVTLMQCQMVRGGLETAVANASGYEGYDRTSFDAIMSEQNFQRSGAVSDEQIRKLGEMAGVQYIIVSEATAEDGQFYVLVKMLDVETGKYGAAYDKLCTASAIEIKKACAELGTKILGPTQQERELQLEKERLQREEAERIAEQKRKEALAEQMRKEAELKAEKAQKSDFTETAMGINMRMVYVEGGTFQMGHTTEQGAQDEYNTDEFPVRNVKVNSFFIGMLEVTQDQWEKVMGSNIYQQRDRHNEKKTYGVGAGYPMYYVSWEEAKEFCARLSRQTGKTYRLPTEAEWEYSARGGIKKEGTKYSGSNDYSKVAWCDDNSGKTTHQCGTKQPNALGLCDMSGNVGEMCEDFYAPYLVYDTDNPKGGTGDRHVYRGGSWRFGGTISRVANRSYNHPKGGYGYLGFRVVLELER